MKTVAKQWDSTPNSSEQCEKSLRGRRCDIVFCGLTNHFNWWSEKRAVGSLIFMSNKLFSLSSKIVIEPAFSYCEIIGIEHRSNDSEKVFSSNHFFFTPYYDRITDRQCFWPEIRCRQMTLLIHQFQNRHFKKLLVHTTMSDARSRQNYDKTLSAVRPTERINFDQLVILTKGKAMYYVWHAEVFTSSPFKRHLVTEETAKKKIQRTSRTLRRRSR